MKGTISMTSCNIKVDSHFTANEKNLLQTEVKFRQDEFT